MNKLKVFIQGNQLSTVTALLLVPFILLFLTARVSPDPWALSPVGVIVAVLFPLTLTAATLRHFRVRWTKINQLHMLSAVMLFMSPFDTDPPPLELSFRSFSDSVVLMGNTWSWRAAIELDPHQGLAGIAPLLHRPIIVGQPVTLVAVHEQKTDFVGLQLLLTEHRQVALNTQSAIFHTIPDQSLLVKDVILLTDNEVEFPELHQFVLNALEYGCVYCNYDRALKVNTDYATKLFLDSANSAIGFLPVNTGGYSTVQGFVHEMFSPHLKPDWNLQVQTKTGGLSVIDGTHIQWFQTKLETYTGSIWDGSGTIRTISELNYVPVLNPFGIKSMIVPEVWQAPVDGIRPDFDYKLEFPGTLPGDLQVIPPDFDSVPDIWNDNRQLEFADPVFPDIPDLPPADFGDSYSLDNPYLDKPFTIPPSMNWP